MRHRLGFTMIELMIAMFMVSLILSAIAVLFVSEQHNFEKPRSAMTSEEDLLLIVKWLKQDLEETDVQTIKSFPDGGDTDPGLSLESPRMLNGSTVRDAQVGGPQGTLDIGAFGVVRWHKFVYYHLVTTTGNAQKPPGTLERFEGPLSDAEVAPIGDTQQRVPVPSAVLPAVGPATRQNERILSQHVVLPNTTVRAGQTANNHVGAVVVPPPAAAPAASARSCACAPPATPDYTASAGGFHVFWKDSTGAQHFFQDGTPPQRGDPVFVELYLLATSERTGQQTLAHYELQVHPRN